jgi:hypothetical protein
MTTSTSGSAKIYTFPPRGRFLVGNTPETVEPLAPTWQPPIARIAPDSGWYHDEAIAQSRQAEAHQGEPRRKN